MIVFKFGTGLRSIVFEQVSEFLVLLELWGISGFFVEIKRFIIAFFFIQLVKQIFDIIFLNFDLLIKICFNIALSSH